jgi:plasmid replication initiation protein
VHQVTAKPEELMGLAIRKKEGILWEITYFVYSRYHTKMTDVSLRSDKYDNLLVPIKNMALFLCVTARYRVNPKYLTPWYSVLPEKLRRFRLVEKLHTY